MAARITALVNPPLLVWAREEAGYSREAAAEKTGFNIEKLQNWERGETKPTLRQAERLAHIYHRPFSVFCLERPPATTPLAAEYRRLPGVKPGKESPELRLALRYVIYRRSVALRLAEELGAPSEPFALKARVSERPATVANRLREALGITVSEQTSWPHEFRAWRRWREAVESLGTLVFQFSKVPTDEVRGFCIFDFPIPVIGINSKEIPASKPFTLLHELVHIMLANAHEERSALHEQRPEVEWKKVEGFAEEVTGEVLLPASALGADPLIDRHSSSANWTVHEISRLARRYKVTPLALATRLLRLGRCSPAAYRRWKDEWEEFLQDHPPRTGGGIASPAEKALNRNGELFTRLVLGALSQDRITSLEAARYLELNYPHVETLRRDTSLARPQGAAT